MIHSYSSLSMYDKCPQQFYQVRVLKAFPYKPGPEAQWGDYVHNELEKAGKLATLTPPRPAQLPPDLAPFQWVVDKLIPMLPGTKMFEVDFNFNRTWHNVGARDWSAKFWTGKGDLVAVSEDRLTGIYIDYKTGNDRYPDTDQLELMGVMMKANYPTLQTVHGHLVFVQTGKVESRTYTEHQLPALRSKWEAKAMDVELAKQSDTWPMKKSPLCPWCPHTTCENWTPPKKK
jgi:hypothetical protein